MTRATAEKVIQGLLAATAALNDTLLIVQAEAPEAFPEFRKHTGQVMGAIYIDLMKRVVKNYPDLDPGARD